LLKEIPHAFASFEWPRLRPRWWTGDIIVSRYPASTSTAKMILSHRILNGLKSRHLVAGRPGNRERYGGRWSPFFAGRVFIPPRCLASYSCKTPGGFSCRSRHSMFVTFNHPCPFFAQKMRGRLQKYVVSTIDTGRRAGVESRLD
jgi:hypothetical protein